MQKPPGRHETPVSARESTPYGAHAGAAACGSSLAHASPRASTATHRLEDPQETPVRLSSAIGVRLHVPPGPGSALESTSPAPPAATHTGAGAAAGQDTASSSLKSTLCTSHLPAPPVGSTLDTTSPASSTATHRDCE